MKAIATPRSAGSLLEPTDADTQFEDVLYEIRGGVAYVTINRPAALNSYTTGTLLELAKAFRAAAWDDRVGVVVFTGAGNRAFSTGGDVKEYAGQFTQRPHDYWKYMGCFRATIEALLDMGKPTIARLNGMAVGGGNELQLACDLSVAADHASLGQVGVGVGSVACGGATQWLPIVVGDRRARAMLLMNERVSARKAESWGLVNRTVASVTRAGAFVEEATPEEVQRAQKGEGGYALDLTRLDAAVDEYARRLLGMFPECLRYTREQTNFWKSLAWHQTIGHARDWLSLHFTDAETYEGMNAFVEKRRPRVADLRDRLAQGASAEYLHGPPLRTCPACGTQGLPADFAHCGRCGEKL